MIDETCPREDELLSALGRGYVGAELQDHTGACTSCSELQIVAGALLEDRSATMADAHVPSAGTMWWRMRVRQVHDAQDTARRWLLAGQAITLMIAVTLVIRFFGSDVLFAVREMAATVIVSTPLLLALAFCLLVVPVAGWVAIRQK